LPEPTFNPRQSEPKWRPARVQPRSRIPDLVRDWLLDEGSLTQLVIRNCPQRFRVRVLSQDWGRPQPSERRALQMNVGGTAFIREVELYCGARPWVFARTLIPAGTLRGGARRLAYLRDRPLGAILFADPRVLRGRLETAELLPRHRLFCAAAERLESAPASLWGRRRLFYIEGKPLLVNEIFLPDLPESK
jgi:chorismate--pyruvate lyase